MKKIIHINGKFLTQPITGVQRYAYELLHEIDRGLENPDLIDAVEIQCLVPPKVSIKNPWKNIPVKPIGSNNGNVWEQIDLPLYLRGGFLFSPANTGPLFYRNQAITMHDASAFAVPHAYSFPFRLKYKLIFKSLSGLAKIIFTDSTFSQQELSHYLNRHLERFNVIHLAGDHINHIDANPEILRKYDLIKDEYVLIIASESPHKNLKTVQKAAKLIKNNIKIVHSGGQNRRVYNNYNSQQLSENTIALGYTNDQEIKSLYQNALGYICPSYYEGFGLPILEAMHCGCPVICARAASLPEVGGNAVYYFEPMDAQGLADAINSLQCDRTLRNDLIEKGYVHTNRFSWATTTRKIFNAMMAVNKT